jgi:hypothetical protein
MSITKSPSHPNTLVFATAFIKSYGSAIALTHQPNTTATTIASALTAHYASTFTAHDHGHTITAPHNDPDFWLKGATKHLQRFQKAGLGWQMSLSDFRIEVVDESTAKCYLTWEIEPLEREGWSWTNMYLWRDEGETEEGGLRGAFGCVECDEETEGLMRRVPGFMELEV